MAPIDQKAKAAEPGPKFKMTTRSSVEIEVGDLLQAVATVKAGKTLRATSQKYKIPYSTLQK